MRKPMVLAAMALVSLVVPRCWLLASESSSQATRQKKLQVLFIGNSFTAHQNLAQVVKAMAEAGAPALSFDVTTVIYGGRRLVDHWRLGSQNFVRITELTAEEEQATIKSLEEMVAKDPNDKYAASALRRHQALSKTLAGQRKKWDFIVLQSYRDDLEGGKSLYAQYAPKFAELVKAQGGARRPLRNDADHPERQTTGRSARSGARDQEGPGHRGPGQTDRRPCRAHVDGGLALPNGPPGPDLAVRQGRPSEPDDGLSHRLHALCRPVQPQSRGAAHRHDQ